MSKYALCFLVLTLICSAVTLTGATGLPLSEAAAKAGIGIFGVLFVVSLFVGRRFKFDPVLR